MRGQFGKTQHEAEGLFLLEESMGKEQNACTQCREE